MPIPPKKMWKFKEIHRFWPAPESQQKDSLVGAETGHLVIKILQLPIIGFLQNWKPFQKMFSHHLPFLFWCYQPAHHLFLLKGGFRGSPLRSAPLRSAPLHAPAKHFITRKQKLHSSWEMKFTTASCFQGRWMKLYGRWVAWDGLNGEMRIYLMIFWCNDV